MSMMKQISTLIQDDLDRFRHELEQSLKSEVGLINTVTRYIMKHKGKQFRPILLLLSARMCGKPDDHCYKAAAMLEMLHVATLVHDDVVDDATLRRGWPSINRIWRNKISILVGDYILSKSLINMISLKSFPVLDIISKTAEDLSSGEILQLEKSFRSTMDEDTYFMMIHKKTASLIGASCELGALTSSGKESDRKALRTFGNNLGMAFQIKDDLFDLLGSESETGKDHGTDVKKNMRTLPIIYALSHLDRPSARQLRRLLRSRRKNAAMLAQLTDLVQRGGGFLHADQKLEEYSQAAKSAIAEYHASRYKQALLDLVAFNAQRKK